MDFPEYPKWLYSKDAAKIVQDQDEADALDGDWRESPADFDGADVNEPTERDALIAKAAALGLKIDKRWNDDKLAEAIAAAAKAAD